MKQHVLIAIAWSLLFPFWLEAKEAETGKWTLQDCLNYALEHNIQVKKSKENYLSGGEDTKQAKAQMFPSLSGSVSQGFTNYPSGETQPNNTYNGNYGLNAGWTLFDGNRRTNSIKQQELQDEVNSLSIEQNENDIRIALVQTYMQVLYAYEAVGINENTVEVSEAQRNRSEELFKAGSISRVDFSQMESQYSTDKYQLVVARKNFDNYKLQLKQLLELDISEEMELVMPDITDEFILVPLPGKESIYATSLTVMPEIKSSELGVDIAGLEIKKAKAGFLPSVSLNAGLSANHLSKTGVSWDSQMWNKLNDNIGLTVSIPIFSNREHKTAVNKARISATVSRLELLDSQKALLRTVEGVYLDAISSQTEYLAADERVNYVEESYKLAEEQFFLGMKNTLELLTEKNNLLSAKQQKLQSKYMAVMSIQLLNIYQNKPIEGNL